MGDRVIDKVERRYDRRVGVERRCHPIELMNVMSRPLDIEEESAVASEEVFVKLVADTLVDTWLDTTVRGWSEDPEFIDYLLAMGPTIAGREDGSLFLAEISGEPAAAGAISFHKGVLLLARACAILEQRRRGAQNALLDARLRFGVDRGCDLAMVCYRPGSASQRNAERNGFRIAYTRCKWARPLLA